MADPELKVFPRSAYAISFARKMNVPNAEVGYIDAPDGSGFIPAVFLRPDQKFLAPRIRERGIFPGDMPS